ncbi:MAG TPA: APC family permease [Vicinamibacteria bacterium]|nr:APC family permease [Vicinamibacteria bacterium]
MWLVGRPLHSADAPEQAIGKSVGLAVFASDPLSSTAYATQQILIVLAAAGAGALHHVFPISVAIVALLAIVTISYWQTLHAYPGGGGAYVVARDNLGELPAQVAAAALLTDYTLTVAVSVSSGMAQIASAFPGLFPYRVSLAIALVMLIMVINLRGVRESGRLLAVPTYFFIAMTAVTVAVGIVRHWTGTLGRVVDPPPMEHIGETQAITVFLLLHAFSSGTTALTGVEAISTGITAFKEPRSRNASITLVWMSAILGTFFLGISYLAVPIGAVGSETETVISQLARTTFGGRGPLYLLAIAATTLILVMAANTAYNGFPRLSALQAADGFLPRQLTYRGSRLVFSRGIVVLAVMASILIFSFQASVTRLIPLYAIGVFLSFTFSQAGMTRRWWRLGRAAAEARTRGQSWWARRGWAVKMVSNGIGAVLTAVVALVFLVTKFHDGAWIILIVIPILVATFFAIHGHYVEAARILSLEDFGAPPRVRRHRVLIPISGVHRGTVVALRYALALSHDITAVHVSADPDKARRIEEKWGLWGNGVRLVVLESPYRLLLEPLLEYVKSVADRRQPNETLTIVVPQFVPRRWWHQLLHAQTAVMLRLALINRPGIVITSVPYQMVPELEEAVAD